jgi:hypothetical protein
LGSNRKLWIDMDVSHVTIWKIHLTLSFPSIFQVVASLLIRNFLIIATTYTGTDCSRLWTVWKYVFTMVRIFQTF